MADFDELVLSQLNAARNGSRGRPSHGFQRVPFQAQVDDAGLLESASRPGVPPQWDKQGYGQYTSGSVEPSALQPLDLVNLGQMGVMAAKPLIRPLAQSASRAGQKLIQRFSSPSRGNVVPTAHPSPAPSHLEPEQWDMAGTPNATKADWGWSMDRGQMLRSSRDEMKSLSGSSVPGRENTLNIRPPRQGPEGKGLPPGPVTQMLMRGYQGSSVQEQAADEELQALMNMLVGERTAP